MVKKKYIPKRGDVVWTNFNPAAGHEQIGKRPALVLSPAFFNKKIMLAMVAPITSRVRGHGFEVPINGKIIITPIKKKKEYKLEELLDQCNPESMEPTKEDQEWLNAEPVGKEVW